MTQLLPPRISVELRAKRLRGSLLQRTREEHFRHHPLCVICDKAGRTSLAVVLDHIIPLDRGGQNEPSNYQGLCEDCHTVKSATEADKSARLKHGAHPSGEPKDPGHHWGPHPSTHGGAVKSMAERPLETARCIRTCES